MSFILDALRKSEHERQRATVPGLSQVPLATPPTAIPRWMFAVIGVLAVAVLALGSAWWRSTHATAPAAQASPSQVVERRVELPAPEAPASPPPRIATMAPSGTVSPAPQAAPTTTRSGAPATEPLLAAAATQTENTSTLEGAVPEASPAAVEDAGTDARGRATQARGGMPAVEQRAEQLPRAVAEPALPSAAALAAEGITVPPLRLELHAYSQRPRDRFVFINGRRYVEGERLPEGPQLMAIEPRGAVLSHLGRRFLLVPE